MIALLFALGSLVLIVIAAESGCASLADGLGENAAMGSSRRSASPAVAVVALQISQTIHRGGSDPRSARERSHARSPFLSRFLVVVVVALTVEGLIGTFKALREA